MVSTPLPRRRLWVRAALVAGIVVSLLGLLAVLRVGPFGGQDAPPLARSHEPAAASARVRLRVLDAEDRPVSSASVFALLRGAGDDAGADRWDPEAAVLTLSVGAGPRSFLVAARGYRLLRVDGVTADRTVRLGRGLRVRLTLRNAPRAAIAEHVRFLLRVRPTAELIRATPGLTGPALVDLLDHLGGPRSGPVGLPRGEFGYAVSRTQAHAGVLVPVPGRYHVHWGLMDLAASTWFSLGDVCGRVVRVREGAEAQRFELDVTEGDLQQTLEGLRTSVQRLDAR